MGAPCASQLNLLRPSIQEEFERFHADNPHVYELLVSYAIKARRAGWTSYGVKSLFERVRWHVHVDTQDEAGFKLNNNYTSRYARMLNEDPRLQRAGFFRTRELKTP